MSSRGLFAAEVVLAVSAIALFTVAIAAVSEQAAIGCAVFFLWAVGDLVLDDLTVPRSRSRSSSPSRRSGSAADP